MGGLAMAIPTNGLPKALCLVGSILAAANHAVVAYSPIAASMTGSPLAHLWTAIGLSIAAAGLIMWGLRQ